MRVPIGLASKSFIADAIMEARRGTRAAQSLKEGQRST
jgi:hypothetical protein